MDDLTIFYQYVRRTSPSIHSLDERTAFLVFAFPVSSARLLMEIDSFTFMVSSTDPPVVTINAVGLPQFFGVCTWNEIANLCVATFRISSAKVFTFRLNGALRYANTFSGDISSDLFWGREIVVRSTTTTFGPLASVGELLVFDSALPDADCGYIEQYLMTKFGIS